MESSQIKIENLTDLIETIILKIDIPEINMDLLDKILNPLIDLDNLIGLETIKQNIFERIIYHLIFGISPDEYFNTVIYGAQGCGKTEIAKIIGSIFSKLGILKTDKFIMAKRDDFIGKYLGQTSPKTKELLLSALDGVLFIDEVYSLAPRNKDNDSYSKEAIDYFNQFLSEYNSRIMVIIAGYPDEIKNTLFKMNQGLESRFPYILEIEKYSGKELYQIFTKFCKKNNFLICTDITIDFFDKNIDYFPAYGRSVCTFFFKCKIACALRKFGKMNKTKLLKLIDLENALKKCNKTETECVLSYFN
jgi:SpoVK/Ycf46/Vps4 family AAA+-type ATPase